VRDIKIKLTDADAFSSSRNSVGALAKNFPAPLKCVDAVAPPSRCLSTKGCAMSASCSATRADAGIACAAPRVSPSVLPRKFRHRSRHDGAQDRQWRHRRRAMGGGIAMNF
jgi:hypothetical protein